MPLTCCFRVELRGFEPLTPSMRTEHTDVQTCLSFVNGARILTPWRRLKIDPLHGRVGRHSSVAAAAGTRPRSRSLSR